MVCCDFKRLARLLEGGLGLNGRLEVLEHLDECKVCRETIYHMSRERDTGYFLRVPYDVEKVLRTGCNSDHSRKRRMAS